MTLDVDSSLADTERDVHRVAFDTAFEEACLSGYREEGSGRDRA